MQDVIVNRRTGRILDGHLRVALALERGEATVLWGTNTRSCRFPIWLSAADPSFVVPHPRGETGTVFVTIEDESGDVQCVLWPRVFARSRQALRGLVLLVTGTVTRWDGTTTLAVAHVESVAPRGFPCRRPTTGTEGNGSAARRVARRACASRSRWPISRPDAAFRSRTTATCSIHCHMPNNSRQTRCRPAGNGGERRGRAPLTGALLVGPEIEVEVRPGTLGVHEVSVRFREREARDLTLTTGQ